MGFRVETKRRQITLPFSHLVLPILTVTSIRATHSVMVCYRHYRASPQALHLCRRRIRRRGASPSCPHQPLATIVLEIVGMTVAGEGGKRSSEAARPADGRIRGAADGRTREAARPADGRSRVDGIGQIAARAAGV